MSVTFRLKNHNALYKYDNPSYNPEEPEDSIYNPKELEEEVYPSMNIANLNAGVFLRKLNMYEPDLCGSVTHEELPSFMEFLKGLSTSDPIDENCNRVSGYANRLLRICQVAKALKDSVVWS